MKNEYYQQKKNERRALNMNRTHTRRIVFLLVIFCFFTLAACAVRTPVQKVEPVKSSIIYENVVFRSFIAAPNVVSPDAAIVDCTNSMITYLTTKNLFRRVEKGSDKIFDEPTLFVDATLTDLRIVSGAARTWGGVMVGRSHMKILVKLTDAKGTLVAEKELFGAPNAYGSAYSFGSSDRELPKNMGILLGDFILANVSAK
jgi:hypothetical protein